MPIENVSSTTEPLNPAILVARDVTKSFPGVRALDRAQLTLRSGEIHALMGENGAGKSTLIKILTGVYQRDSGSLRFADRSISPRSPSEAEAIGISTVYQEVNLIPTLSVAENLLLGREPRRFGLIRWAAMKSHAEHALKRLNVRLDVGRELRSYPIALQQMVAIARALDVQARLLVLDEPTSSLDEGECQALFQVMRRLRDEGLAILFVTHFLDQVYAVADRITVLRNGGFVGEFRTATLSRLELIGKMLGRELTLGSARSEPAEPGFSEAESSVGHESKPSPSAMASTRTEPFLEARGLGRRGGVHALDLVLSAGEVVGLAGLLGSGRTETARLLFGIDLRDTGEIRIAGRPTELRSPRAAIQHGLAFCSEDRKSEGILPHLSVRENLVLAMQASRGPLRRIPLAAQLEIAGHYIRALNIKTPSPEAPIRNLSGGNQQKVLLARWLALQPKLIILDEPTRGIDVGAKADVETLVDSLRRAGMAVLFISSELEEVVRVSERVVVLRDRKKVGELTGEIEEQEVMALMAQPHD